MSKARPEQAKFEQYYGKLNPAQKLAVDSIEGPVMVVAGPGTGKTQVLTLRIANILRQTDTPPDGVLALTFTKSGVQAMRQRLVEIAGPAGYRVSVNTFHGFCNDLITKYPEEFPRIIGSRPATRVQQIKALEQAIDESELELLRPYGAPYYYLHQALSAIDRLKKDNVTPKDFAKQADSEKARELALIYQRYEAKLREQLIYDFSDMIMEVLAVMRKKKDFLRRLQEEYLYILADEHQDANQSQNQLLTLLASFHPEPNLFLVGDEKQAIFQFQGASLENFNYFQQLYPRAKLITLTENYRSGQKILDAAGSLMPGSARLKAAAVKSPALVRVVALANPTAEERYLVAEIKRQLANGVPADEIAVIYRDNADAEPIIEALDRAGIPLVVQSQTDLLSDNTIGKLLLLLEAVQHFGDDNYLLRVLHLDLFDLDPLAVYPIKNYQDLKNSEGKLAELYQSLVRWRKLAKNENLSDFISAVLEESGFFTYLLAQPAAEDKLAKLQSFYEETKELATGHPHYRLSDFFDQLATLKRHGLGLPQTVLPPRSGVRLMTAHGSKGLEFRQVYIVRATDGHFGHRRAQGSLLPSEAGDESAERRLFYVALTRARQGVTITYAQTARDGRPQLPTQYIAEIRDEYLEQLTAPELAADVVEHLRPRVAKPSQLAEREYLNQLFRERGFSATDLNTYLRCPLEYYYRNLLRLYREQNKHLLYGTAVHAALKEFFDAYKTGKTLSQKDLLERLHYHLALQPLSPRDLADSLRKGEEALGGYYEAYRGSWGRDLLTELNARAQWGEIVLTGRVDKLELLGAGQVRVVDYKTGKPKSRNHILGLTRAEDGGEYYRQLLFYKLLLEQYQPTKYRVLAGVIDFIEPDDKGRYKREEFELNSDEVEKLATQIKQIAAEILSLEFLNKGCGKKDCEACRLWRVTR